MIINISLISLSSRGNRHYSTILLGNIDGLLLDIHEVIKCLRNVRTRKEEEEEESIIILQSLSNMHECINNTWIGFQNFKETVSNHNWK